MLPIETVPKPLADKITPALVFVLVMVVSPVALVIVPPLTAKLPIFAVVNVMPEKVGDELVAMDCGSDKVIEPAPGVTVIWLVVPVKVLNDGLAPVEPIINCPLVSA